ncbi:hypothetical protein [Lewinella sp. 4G2]|uniref:hypothetical protein n=1 Tax=Lewinella sp. 4G2 TaxID=1803372 RepID=UPI0007B4A437|nr:hypothetical protein [Lewinella sp. 4G2]OAV44876.1 hypothetical protein A3850_010405 [Lewinella sp. 4G2]
MRLHFLILTLLFTAAQATGQGLADFDATSEPAAFDEALEAFMTGSGNKAAKESYSNFNGIFFGGGFTEEQQKQIAATAVLLSQNRVTATGGFIPYLAAQEFLTGAVDAPNPLFESFHAALSQVASSGDARVDQLNKTLQNAAVFLEKGWLKPGKEDTGWRVIGGKPTFLAEDNRLKIQVDTIRELIAISPKDTIKIKETNLLVDLAMNAASGKGGRTDWRRVGLSPDIFVILVQYELDAGRMIYKSDSAQFQYPEYFGDRILMGSFNDKNQVGGVRPEGDFPQFLSDDGYVEIKNIGKNVTLFGNFELKGNTVYAIGEEGREAYVRLRLQGSATDRSVQGEARRFVVRQGKSVGGEGVRTTVKVGQDSLFHPSVTMYVDLEDRIVGLRRSKSSADRAPFYHSKNAMAIFSDYLDIHLDGDSAVIGKPTVSFQEKPDVVFESSDYYSQREYEYTQDIASSNPLERIYSYRQNQNGGMDDLHADDLAKFFRKDFTATDIKPLLYDLQTAGFLLYNPQTNIINLKRKLSLYVEASREEVDYDKLRVVSRTPKPNAVMNMVTGDIRVDAVLPVEFNKEKKIAIRPAGNQLTIRNNRDLDFSGEVYAGGIVMSGKGFHFKYDPYYIELDSVRYVDLFLPEGDDLEAKGNRRSAGSRIEHVTGYLLIDAPKNKSGTENIPYFPSLQSKEISYIYYDGADSTAAYDRDEFYFELQPFSLNGTDSLLASDLALGGKLNSGGIFPDIEETLTIQEDGSLGFVTETPEGGQSTYEDRGNYEGELVLTNKGLKGTGKLSYLEANIESDNLDFRLDRTTASSNSFALEESAKDGRVVPQVAGTEVNVEFIPYGDSLVVEAAEGAAFDMFKAGDHQLEGTLVLTPEALKANGTLDWDAASMTSKDMDFTLFGAKADTSNVSIKSLQAGDQLALTTTNVQSSFDFEKQSASFRNNSTDLSTDLPYTQFKTSINEFDWDMATGNITFKAEPGKDRFTSTHPDQDELTFTGESATYDINTNVLGVEGVPFVTAADARIYPGDGRVEVEGGAKVRELTNARIVADTLNEYHVIKRATVNLMGRKEYTASGFYEYNVGPHRQEVEFQNIIGTRVGKGKKNDKATATRAEGTVEESTSFYVDNKTKFFGTINLDAGSKTLLFDGYAKIDAEKLPGAQWFTVQSEGDKKDLTLEVREPKDRDGLPLFTGLYLSKPNRGIYPSMVQTLDFRKDHAILDANGLMNYDEENDVFLFGDSLRIFDETQTTGNLMRFDNANGKIDGSGELGLGGRLEFININAYGTIKMDMPTGQRVAAQVQIEEKPAAPEPEEEEDTPPPSMFLLEEETVTAKDTTQEKKKVELTINAPVAPSRPEVLVEAMMAIDLIFPDKLVNMMANDVLSGTFASPGLNLVTDREFYSTGLETLFLEGKERAGAIASLDAGVLEVPRKINEHTLFFPKMKLKWSDDYQSFVSTEKLNGLASIRGNTVSKMVEVYTEIKMPTGGDDRLYIYLKTPSELYYFFGFQAGVLNVVSNNTQFMDELEGMKPKDLVKKIKGKDGGTYEILPVSPATADTFLRRVKDAF